MSRIRAAAALAAASIVAGVAGCARQEAPPGGPEDRRPPVVIRTVPAAFDTVESLDEVRFEFDERISERVAGGTLDGAVTVSPRSGAVRVNHHRRALSIELEDGFLPGLVYRVTLQPVVSDLFSNRLTDPFELVFSTGGDPVPTTLAGEVWDRISGGGVSGALVFATDSAGLVHQASSGEGGIYAFRYLPSGDFDVTAFEDVNRNGEVDSTEVQGLARASLAPGDTLLLDVAMLEPDTAAAILVSARAVDSVTAALTFDDYLDPEHPADELTVSLRRAEGEGGAPGVVRLWQEAEYAAHIEAVTDSFARLDSLEAEAATAAVPDEPDSLAAAAPADPPPADSAEAPTDTAGAGPIGAPTAGPGAAGRRGPTPLPPLEGAAPGPTRDGRRVLPGRRIVVLLDAPLPFDSVFEVEAAGVVNIAGLEDGGGTAELVRETPPPDTTAVADSVGAADSTETGAVPAADSTTAPAAPPDTVFVPDTTLAPDTIPGTDTTLAPDTTPGTDTTVVPDTGWSPLSRRRPVGDPR